MANLLMHRRNTPFLPLFGDWMDDLWSRTSMLPTMSQYPGMPAVERYRLTVKPTRRGVPRSLQPQAGTGSTRIVASLPSST